MNGFVKHLENTASTNSSNTTLLGFQDDSRMLRIASSLSFSKSLVETLRLENGSVTYSDDAEPSRKNGFRGFGTYNDRSVMLERKEYDNYTDPQTYIEGPSLKSR